MSKALFLREMGNLYEQVKEKGITTSQLLQHIQNTISLPKEEGWKALEELFIDLHLVNVKKIPQCYGYEVTASRIDGVEFHIYFEEITPKLTLIMYNSNREPWGYEERIFRNSRELGPWLRRTINRFLESYDEKAV
ncbi:hypothetical protein [Ammoniphilus sp. CFH 90114]|uniref:hypothetical protein n=1 Tax=Ammoniphilus sp. CFH 90114 TaxID=2493665 RepID=UPI00100F6775|nr:hypothetical protein [Ammoniphilus sp. CFH 90114]RXT13749.1 hypothetical protein EIZ39_06275 [Ammoniphilus sp. CFH 90114]